VAFRAQTDRAAAGRARGTAFHISVASRELVQSVAEGYPRAGLTRWSTSERSGSSPLLFDQAVKNSSWHVAIKVLGLATAG
jgi:hypothetical protein